MVHHRSAVILVITAVLLGQIQSSPILRNDDRGTAIVQSCPSPIYCQGKLLEVVQTAHIFNDSKTFVDMSQVYPAEVTLKNFWDMMNSKNGTPSRDDVRQFVGNNFVRENETVSWTPTDFTDSPLILNFITDEQIRTFAKDLINIWPILGRKTSEEVINNPDQHSLLEVPNGFIVPGGRFRELYYWDSFWIMKGLLLSDMYLTVKGMLGNICHLINKYGFMPNGGRVYYLNRSQPPLFTLMIQQYLKYTEDYDWIKDNIQCVQKEMDFWLKNRTINVVKDGTTYQLAHYGPESNTPRPESYEKDLKTCSFYGQDEQKKLCYKSLKSGAETGWDFSSRWFFDQTEGNNANLSYIRAQRVVPVDLNSFLCTAFGDLAEFYGILGDIVNQKTWQERSDVWKHAIEMVFYDSEEGIWFDWDSELHVARRFFFPSNFAPLWAKAYDENKKDDYGLKAADYFLRKGIDQFLGGIPTSLEQTGEQWDFRNAWPPLQEFVVLGLLQTGNSNATDVAITFGKRWVLANMKGYDENKIMFEKYDALDPGKFGGGGEYVVQSGFGWTNGVALSFIDLFYTNK
ncbi:trehalase-like [Anthonomus grandis grandis]|uniref:trehalase-like n=1 Tax=Anthonomus grandis grandis TaxID=2921223 RepID=UPI0021666A61|nr:trehalase-like [Anthonomus grandis grandis]XP_050298172.1 trehalase-like [Anthonomus grandis grandis]XP_050298173.1 trehalase-like [Anthonomus grandis grandis]XP_050298174.1 trehalase-like [Anthonomus grandis grandis]XP_050298175.1 trehalase-like [Anthonomus grandis grandis]XP_050298176.1 trehalase-like [Anthonomus grandis grandis]XP_050298177.1 trehalase-like [Anthonomus grandis grandis]